MKMKSFLIPALALALAGCANEELETIGSGTIPAVPSGQTILFSNNTALTIGDADGVQTRAMGWTEVTDKVNSACWLEMDVKPTPSGNDVYIKSGEEEVYNRLLGKSGPAHFRVRYVGAERQLQGRCRIYLCHGRRKARCGNRKPCQR